MTTIVVRRSPLRNIAGWGLWRATVYLASYLPTGLVLFGGGAVMLVVCLPAGITWLGLPLLIGAAAFARGAAHIERHRALLVGERIEPAPRAQAGHGLIGTVRSVWSDRGTWKAAGYVLLLFPLLFVLDFGALLLWVISLAGVTLPLWYWSLSMRVPNGTRINGMWLGYPVDNLPVALLTALGFAVLAVALAYVVIGAAVLHRAVVAALLGPRLDPLAEVRRELAEPGPLNAYRLPTTCR
jgi:hypothetical protein